MDITNPLPDPILPEDFAYVEDSPVRAHLRNGERRSTLEVMTALSLGKSLFYARIKEVEEVVGFRLPADERGARIYSDNLVTVMHEAQHVMVRDARPFQEALRAVLEERELIPRRPDLMSYPELVAHVDTLQATVTSLNEYVIALHMELGDRITVLEEHAQMATQQFGAMQAQLAHFEEFRLKIEAMIEENEAAETAKQKEAEDEPAEEGNIVLRVFRNSVRAVLGAVS